MPYRICLFIAALVIVAVPSVRDALADGPKHKLRIATAAPDGTGWAHTIRRFARDLARDTDGEVEAKFYFGGIAGSEMEVFDLMQAGKLDGAISGGPLCRKVAPSMRVLGVVGLFQNQEEATYVLAELRPKLDSEAHDAGYHLMATGSLGPFIVFSREPLTSMTQLRNTPLSAWELNNVFLSEAAELELAIVPTSLANAQKAFDDKRVHGFITTPVAALAFQWYASTKYITDLRLGYIMGCFVLRQAAVDALGADHQATLRKHATRLGIKIDFENRRVEQKLLGGAYERLGLKFVPVSKKFRAEFFDAARGARQRLSDTVVPRDLLDNVVQMLADYRAEND